MKRERPHPQKLLPSAQYPDRRRSEYSLSLGTVMDIFRLEDGKIVEHWDVLQEVPEKADDKDEMF